MGGFPSSEDNEDKKSSQSQDQHIGHYHQHSHQSQYHQQQRAKQHPPQQWQQQQQQLHRQQQGQQQRRYVSTFSTPEILAYLERDFMSTVGIIQNMRKEKNFDDGARAYILQEMNDTEMRLAKFNNSMRKVGRQEYRQGDAFEQEMQQLKDEIKALKEKNNHLEHEKSYLDGLLTHDSMKRPSNSDRPQSSCGVPTRNNDRVNQKDNMKDAEELKQRIAVCTRELESERVSGVKAVSYIEHLKEENNRLMKEKNELQSRLSKVACEKLTENNPAIADLSDPNRPTKIGEMYSEMYDNEWTDAFESLVKAGYADIEAIETLRLTLLSVFQFCNKKSESLLKKTEEAVNILFEEYKASEQMSDMRHLTMPRKLAEKFGKVVQQSSIDFDAIFLQQNWKPRMNIEAGEKRKVQTLMKPNKSGEVIAKQLKIFRKEVAVSMVPLVEKAYMSASWNEECVYHLKPFIRKCILLGWMMVVQSPPMALAEFEPNEKLRKEFYKEYTKSGTHVEYVVWPALLLEKGGPVVGKGVAQGKK